MKDKYDELQHKIYMIRGVQVMLDSDLAALYGVGVKRLNEQVKRNIERFPVEFMFQLTIEEYEALRSSIAALNLRSQFATSSLEHGGRRYMPRVFTEQGVAMLSAVLKSKTAINMSIK
ncbi:MAG TPA: ORF6N domain-containing protein, partial [bacterium]|nr:ORF6N domain-containing protein [bacterium]